MKFHVPLIVIGLASLALASPASVEPQILKNLEKASTTNVLVTFKKSNVKAAFARFDSLALNSRNGKLNSLYAILKDHSDAITDGVIAMLEKTRSAKRHNVSQLWISAELIVRDADKETVEALRNHPDVESLVAEKFFPLETVEIKEMNPEDVDPQAQWGVEMVRAKTLWDQGNQGEGIVVATIDTGVRYTHTALNSNYRGTNTGSHNYNWYDPLFHFPTPSDLNGHGTHTMGSIAGTANGIGVAPGAQWIACRGCSLPLLCSNFELLQCGNWVTCPTTIYGTNPDCSKAPNVCSNSWGGGQGDTSYASIIDAWRRANIVPVFANGNAGPNCGTANSPADNSGVIAVGSITSANMMSNFSSAGPSVDGRMKPDVAAPGSNIVSASYSSDTGYATMSGTSMACPHAAGVSALLLKARPNLTVDQLRTALVNGAQGVTSSGMSCNGVSDSTYPNHQVGAGRFDAAASVEKMNAAF